MTQIDPQALPSSATRHVATGASWPNRLSVEIWLHRHGWALPTSVLVLLLVVGVLFAQVMPALGKVEQLRTQLQSAQASPVAAPPPPSAPPAEPGQSLRTLLSQVERSPAQVRRVASIARQHGISLPRGQYTSSRQTPSGIEHTDITFSFVAGYPESRAFIESVLRQLPNASVDRVSFERDQAQGTDAEITLRLTLWRWPAPPKAEAER